MVHGRAGILPGFWSHLTCPRQGLRASGPNGDKVFPGGHDLQLTILAYLIPFVKRHEVCATPRLAKGVFLNYNQRDYYWQSWLCATDGCVKSLGKDIDMTHRYEDLSPEKFQQFC